MSTCQEAFTSTPVCDKPVQATPPHHPHCTAVTPSSSCQLQAVSKLDFRTPVINRASHRQLLQPRTPTPFKNHLASLEQKSGVVRLEVCVFSLPAAVFFIIYLYFVEAHCTLVTSGRLYGTTTYKVYVVESVITVMVNRPVIRVP